MEEICDVCENRSDEDHGPAREYEGGIRAHDDCAVEIGLPEGDLL